MTASDPSDAGLRYADDARPGIARKKRGRGVQYLRADGEPVNDATRARIEALAIPPAWTSVWIAPDPRAYLQATGRDARGRKQYRYHADWTAHRDRLKFEHMAEFGAALPALRARVEADLRPRGIGRDKVVALAVRLLDETLVRIGNAEYADANGTFGLTTLRDRHVAFEGADVTFSFVGKSGKAHALRVADRRIARLVRACRDLPGYDLFQYQTDDGARATVGSGDVNAYLRGATGADVTAKDFRTWGGTTLAAEHLAGVDAPEGDAVGVEKAVGACIKEVAGHLGNTVAVCRQYYVHPDVLGAFRDGTLRERVRRRNAGNTPAGLRPAEAAVLDLLRDGG
jgi:DNA topoisomerase-1